MSTHIYLENAQTFVKLIFKLDLTKTSATNSCMSVKNAFKLAKVTEIISSVSCPNLSFHVLLVQ